MSTTHRTTNPAGGTSMNRITRIAAATVLLASPVVVAHATDDGPTPVRSIAWQMPAGGTPDNVTWPQTYTPAIPKCVDAVFQVDRYAYNDTWKAAVDALYADGILTKGEDRDIPKSWTFVTVSATDEGCEPEPEPTPTPEPEQPPVVTPPAVTPEPTPVPVAQPGPVTPSSPKDLTALSTDERAGVESFAKAHGIAPEAVLVEMG